MWANPSRRSSFSAASTVVEKGGGGEALSISIISFPTLFLLFFFPGMIQSQRKAAAQEKDSTYHAREGREREREKGKAGGGKGRATRGCVNDAGSSGSIDCIDGSGGDASTHARQVSFCNGKEGRRNGRTIWGERKENGG